MEQSTQDQVKADAIAAQRLRLPEHREMMALLTRVRLQQRAKHRLTEALRELPSVIYAIKTDDGMVKIGYTSDLGNRLRKHGITRDKMHRLLFVFEGTIHDERALHRRFRSHLAPNHGRETYLPTAELIAYINEHRERLGVRGVLVAS